MVITTGFMVQTVQTVWMCRNCSSSSRTLTSLLVALRQIPVVLVRFHSCRTLGGRCPFCALQHPCRGAEASSHCPDGSSDHRDSQTLNVDIISTDPCICSVFAGEVQDYGFILEMTSEVASVFSTLLGSPVDTCMTSIYEAMLIISVQFDALCWRGGSELRSVAGCLGCRYMLWLRRWPRCLPPWSLRRRLRHSMLILFGLWPCSRRARPSQRRVEYRWLSVYNGFLLRG